MGKSACATWLGDRGSVRAVVEVDAFRRLVPAVDWSDRNLHDVAQRAATDTACAYAAAGFSPVVLVDCFGRDHAIRVIEHVRGLGVDARLVSLWARADVLRARLMGRGHHSESDVRIAELINDEVRAKPLGGSFVDTSSLDVGAVAQRVASGLASTP